MKMNKIGLLGCAALMLQACTATGNLKTDPVAKYASPEELITQKNLNGAGGGAKEYIYAWGASQKGAEPHSLYPRKYLSRYCQAKGGRFSLLYKSTLSLVKEGRARNALAANMHVKQGIGAYQCQMPDGQRWIVSIEPTAEQKSVQYADARAVKLKTELMTEAEAKRFYKELSKKELNPAASQAKKVPAAAVKPAPKTQALKDVEEKKEQPAAEKAANPVPESLQQRQMKYYVTARRDLSKGQNPAVACGYAQRAFGYGKLQGTDGTRIYTESGMLVARCLTSVPEYSRQFPNAKARAVGILQNLSKNYNHAGAKYMLNQIK